MHQKSQPVGGMWSLKPVWSVMISHCGGAADFAHHHTPFLKIPYKFRFAKVFHFRLSFFEHLMTNCQMKGCPDNAVFLGFGLDSARPVSCFSCCVSKQFSSRPDRPSSSFRQQPNTGNKERTIRLRRIDERSKVNGAELFLEWTETDTTSLEYWTPSICSFSCFPTGEDEARAVFLFRCAAVLAFGQLIAESTMQ